jgi:hypothetical protein
MVRVRTPDPRRSSARPWNKCPRPTKHIAHLPLPIARPPFVGEWLDVGPYGTIEGTLVGDSVVYGHLGSVFTYAPGVAKSTGGTGIFEGAHSSTTYEFFAVGTGGPETAASYSSIVVNRVNTVPEPTTGALVIFSLGLLALSCTAS